MPIGRTDTITGGLAADNLTGGAGADQFVFTSGLTIDTVTDFTAAQTDVAAFSLAALETAGATIAGSTLDFVLGSNVSVAAGGAISVQAIAGAVTIAAATNVFNYTAAAVDNAAALETALEATGITAAGALAVNDSFLIQYTTAAGVQNLAVATVTNATNAAALVGAHWDVTDIASLTGGIADLAAAQYAFVA